MEDALAAAAESGIDDLVADARERRRRLHWCSQPHPTVIACCSLTPCHRLQQHVLLPDIRTFMAPPDNMASDGSIIQVRAARGVAMCGDVCWLDVCWLRGG